MIYNPFGSADGTNATLLIDLENFFLGREENINGMPSPHLYSFKEDLERLYNFAVDLAGDRRLVVRRAYANFNAWRIAKEGGPKDYYLQQLPNLLMDKGIEPVQVFRFPGGGNKNASDMPWPWTPPPCSTTRPASICSFW